MFARQRAPEGEGGGDERIGRRVHRRHLLGVLVMVEQHRVDIAIPGMPLREQPEAMLLRDGRGGLLHGGDRRARHGRVADHVVPAAGLEQDSGARARVFQLVSAPRFAQSRLIPKRLASPSVL